MKNVKSCYAKTTEKSDTLGHHRTADRKLPAAAEIFDSLQQQQLRRNRRDAYSQKLSEILNRLHKTTPCSTTNLDGNKNEKNAKMNPDFRNRNSGPEYTFDNYSDVGTILEDLESNNQTDQLEPRSVSFADGPKYILESSDFYQDEEETPGDDSDVGKATAVESRQSIMRGTSLVNREDSISQRKVSFNNNVETINNTRSRSQNPSGISQEHDELELDIKPGAVAVSSDSKERYRPNTGTRIHSGSRVGRLRHSDASSQLDGSDLRYSIYSKISCDSKNTSTVSFETKQQQYPLENALQAYRVEECDIESRRAAAPVIAEAIDTKAHRKIFVRIFFVGLALVAGIVVLIVLFTKKRHDKDRHGILPTPSPTSSTINILKPTMELVKERGVLKCGVPKQLLGFAILNTTTGELEGFEIDSCRAVAAAIMGSNYSIQPVELTWAERFVALANKSVDLLTQASTHTTERDVYQSDAETGLSFSVPYLYDGLGFGGKPMFVECADNIQAYNDCSKLKVCVIEKTTHYQILKRFFPSRSLVTSSDGLESLEKFIDGDCNVIAGERTATSELSVRAQGYTGSYAVGQTLLSKEWLAIVTREDDHEWSQVVNWVLQAQFIAEALNITKENASEFSNVSPFGIKYNEMFTNALSAVGNYGERYERYMEKVFPRMGLNKLYLEDEVPYHELPTNGLICSYPFGSIDNDGPEPIVDSKLNTISKRGVLRCGVTEFRVGFAKFNSESQKWEGLDIDYCKAIAAAMFGGMIDSTVEYINLTEKSAFDALSDDDVDLVCGVDIDIEANIEKGISFSLPYFYEGQRTLRSLATYGKDDPQFSDFVWWVVIATFYAEEENITSGTSNDMPRVRIFGQDYNRMFHDTILVTGNYGDMYERNVQPIIPRSGRNNLNNPMIGPQINPYVGF